MLLSKLKDFGGLRILVLAVMVGLGAGFCIWAGYFIYQSSFIDLDGVRRFSLFDDSMISMRYAFNLAEGNGLVWNPGERVEGFTNMLMTLLMALSILLFGKFQGVLAIQVIGVVSMLGVGVFSCLIGLQLMERMAPERSRSMHWEVLFFVCGLAYYPLSYWSLMGMEVGLVAMLLYAALWRVLKMDGQSGICISAPVLLGLAFWTRPDASWPSALIMLYRLSGLVRRPGFIKTILKESAVLAGFVATLSLFRLIYYGSVVPNTYVLKMTGLDLSYRIENCRGYLEIFFKTGSATVVMAAVGGALAFSRHAAIVVALVCGAFVYQLYVGGDPWLYWRMLAPYIPLAFVLTVLGVVGFWRHLDRLLRGALAARKWSRSLVGVLCFTSAIGALGYSVREINRAFDDEITFDKKPYLATANKHMVDTGLALAQVTEPDAVVGVLWAGAIPYFSERRALDYLGKSDPYIARVRPDTKGGVAWRGMKSVPGHNKYDLKHSIVEKRPTYTQTAKWGRQSVRRFVNEHYIPVRYKGVVLLLLKGSPAVRWDLLKTQHQAAPR